MKQRIITGVSMISAVFVLLVFGGILAASVAALVVGLSLYEEFKALKTAGHHPVEWPAWAVTVIAAPCVYLWGNMMPLLMLLCVIAAIAVVGTVVFRKGPKVEDIVYSILPVLTITLPGLFMIEQTNFAANYLGRMYLSLLLFVPILGDTFAYFVGSKLRGPKLCPEVSPNKTISGAVGGLLGSVIAAMAIYGITIAASGTQGVPTWWMMLLLGLVGGVAAQIGDLFHSLLKRHCGIKDFSNMFPGHGGMLDRMDSILFGSVVVYLFHMLVTMGV